MTDWNPAYFRPDPLTQATPLTLDPATGQLFGHVACWDCCHLGYPGECVTPPRSSPGYPYFNLVPLTLADSTVVLVGAYTVDTGHANDFTDGPETQAHYDDTGSIAAAIHVYDDDWGIVAAGQAPYPEFYDALMLSSPSGDWRDVCGKLELVGLLAVPRPGFPVPTQMEQTLAASSKLRNWLDPEAAAVQTAAAHVVDQESLAVYQELLRLHQV